MEKMQSSHDCGPVALANATGKPINEVKAAMRWPDRDDVRDDLMDSPAAHFIALQRLGVPYRVVTAGQILRGECQPVRTVILLHGDGAVGAWMAQHWVNLAAVVQIQGVTHVQIHWGDGAIRQYNEDQFVKRYRSGGPTNTAYECYSQVAKPLTGWKAKVANVWASVMGRLFGRK